MHPQKIDPDTTSISELATHTPISTIAEVFNAILIGVGLGMLTFAAVVIFGLYMLEKYG